MIDITTFFKMHSKDPSDLGSKLPADTYDPWPNVIAFEDKMTPEKARLLPEDILGFDMRVKTWRKELPSSVSRMTTDQASRETAGRKCNTCDLEQEGL